MNLVDKLTFRKQVEQEATDQASKEKISDAKDALLKFYKKKESATQLLKNIQNEIDDYLMQLEDK